MATPSDEDAEMLVDFLVEAWEQLEILDREFVALEEDPTSSQRINNIFRVMHTLKGGAGFLGLEMLECLTHYAETLLSRIREGELSITSPRITLLLQTADAAKGILRNLESQRCEGEARFNDLMVGLKRAAEAVEACEPEVAFRQPAGEKSALEELQVSLMAALDQPEASPASQPDEEEHHPAPPSTAPEPVVEHEDHSVSISSDSRIRVHVNLLDKLMNLVGELVLSRNQILQVAGGLESPALSSACQRINLVTSELQEHIMQTRMQPISTLLNRFPRIVRDLCSLTGKDARFSMEGQDTGLDRTILDAIKDPLTHILRNSIDHGLEAPDVRLQRGKKARGSIHVRAYHEGGQVTIEIMDDGAGIDLARVRSKAVSQRLLSPQEAERLSERDTVNLIFQPGFSTVDQVTNLSGRGVGMDVVRSSVEKIGGTVDLSTRPGEGTTVKLRLPLTLAIIPALLVTSGQQRYAIPQVNLQELVRLEGPEAVQSIEKIYGSEVYRLRGELLPLLRLRNLLGMPSEPSDTVNIVVLSSDGSPFGLIVDGVCDTEEIVVKPLSRELKQLQLYAGATIMGDGRVALIVDVGGLARTSRLELEKASKGEKSTSTAGKGPSSQSLLLFRLGGQELYAIPLTLLSRLEEFSLSQIETIRGKRVVQYRGRLLPLVDMAGHFGCYGAEEGETVQVLVFSHQGNDLGMVVGEILDVVDEVLSIEPGTATFGTLGSSVISGRATTLVDLHGLIQATEPDWLQPQNAAASSARPSAQRMLVVDDSPFCSALTTSYLQAEGINVQVCRDRQSLLERLSRDQYDGIIVEAGCSGADQMLEALTGPSSSYRRRTLATTHRGTLRNSEVPAVEPFGRQRLLEALVQLTTAQ